MSGAYPPNTQQPVPTTNPQQLATDNSRNDLLGAIQQAIKALTAAFALVNTRVLIALSAEGTILNNEQLPPSSNTLTTTFPINMGGSTGYAVTAPTAGATFTFKIYPGATTVFTATFAAAANTPTFVAASSWTLGPGQALVPFGPSPADLTLANVTIAIQGT